MKVTSVVFSLGLLFLSCSKSNSSGSNQLPAQISSFSFTNEHGNTFTYSDTAIQTSAGAYSIRGVSLGAGVQPVNISLPSPTNISQNYYGFEFNYFTIQSTGGVLSSALGDSWISLRLPIFSGQVLNDTLPDQPTFDIRIDSANDGHEMTYYPSPSAAPNGSFKTTLYSTRISIAITDTAGGYATGSFNISSKTHKNQSIKASGTFSNVKITRPN